MQARFLLIFLLAACGPSAPQEDRVTDVATVSIEATAVFGPTSSTGDSETDMDENMSTSGLGCYQPDDNDVLALWSISVNGERPPDSISAQCVVIASIQTGPEWMLGLDCMLDGHSARVDLLIAQSPAFENALLVGDVQWFEYRSELMDWKIQWFVLRSKGFPFFMSVSGISAETVAPPKLTATEFFGINLSEIDDVCEALDDGSCSPTRRLAVATTLDSENEVIYDGQYRSLQGDHIKLGIWVGLAIRRMEPASCEEAPPSWFDIVMAGV